MSDITPSGHSCHHVHRPNVDRPLKTLFLLGEALNNAESESMREGATA